MVERLRKITLREAKVERISLFVKQFYNNFFDEYTTEKIKYVVKEIVPIEWQEEVIDNMVDKLNKGILK